MADDKGIQLTVQGDSAEVKFEKGNQNLNERDPNNINDHLRVAFDEVFGEPDPGVFSFDKIWTLSYTVFSAVKLWTYRITSLICGLPLMVFWGCYFACLSFCTIWCCAPCFRAYELNMHCVKKFWNAFVSSIYGPCCETAGLIFSKIKIEKV
ncbi:caveolin-3-like [Tubulanus polymorphus]|uniref:caveolin-3-like n=1 Tax=Tubulanus polymorphus TaxID=672921 RepID=UPI003DA30FF7